MAWPPRPASPLRAAALAAGKQTYSSGKPCKHGHEGPRYAISRGCVECQKRHSTKWAANNPENCKAKSRRHYLRNYEKELARGAAYREANPEKVKAGNMAWREANPDAWRASYTSWKQDNPLKVSEHHNRRRARAAQAEGSHTAFDLERIKASQRGRCACCGKRKKLTADHIVPLARGGSNWPSNIQLLCRHCNSSKGARDPIEFMQNRGMLL